MIRLTLRQFRTAAISSFGLLAVLAILLVITGPHFAHVNDAFGHACSAARDCATAPNPSSSVDPFLQSALPFIVTVAPALMGMFFGAPLIARERETGTFRLAWTQSVTRRRWLVVKLGIVGLASMVIGGLLTWMVDWWWSPLDALNKNRFDPSNFGIHGVAPIGYAAFAFVLGATVGAVLRRTVPAMAVTLVGFVAARLAIEYRVRPYFAGALHKSLSLAHTGFGSVQLSASAGTSSLVPPSVSVPNAWELSTAVRNTSGQSLTNARFLRTCPVYRHFPPPSPSTMQTAHAACINKLTAASFRTLVTYQPGSRFWPFQWTEMGIFLVAALGLCGFTYWWLQREYS